MSATISSSAMAGEGNSQRFLFQSFRELFAKIDKIESSLVKTSSGAPKEESKEKEESEWGDFVPLMRPESSNEESGKKRTQVLQKQQYSTMTMDDIQRETKKKLNMLLRTVKSTECSEKNIPTIETCMTLIYEILHNGLMKNGLKVVTTQKGGQLDELKSVSAFLYRDAKDNKAGSNEIENNVAGTSYASSLKELIDTLKGKREMTNEIVFLKALIGSVLCYFDHNQQESHRTFVELSCYVLHFLINECYKLLYPDPRELLYRGKKDDESDAHLFEIQNAFNLRSSDDEESSGPMEGTILTPMEFCQLFKVYSLMVQRALTTSYPFTISINAHVLINRVLQEAFLLQAISIQVLKKPNRDVKSILYNSETNGERLQASFYAIMLPTIHSECLKILSALVLTGKEQLLPYINSICQILTTESRNWKSSMLIALCDYCNSEPYFEVYKELMRCLTIITSKHGGKVSEKLTQVVLPNLIDIISQFTYFVEQQIFSLPLTQLQQQSSVENYELTLKKKKKKRATKMDDELVLNPEIFSQFSRIVFVTLKAIQHMMNDSSVLITATKQVDSSRYKTASETENSVVDVLGNVVDLITNVVGFVKHWHELDAFFATNNVSIYSASQVKSYHQDLIPIIVSMYEALTPSLLSTSSVHTQSPFLPHVITILQNGIQTTIPEIISASMTALNVIESYMHPKSAPLYVPSAESVQSGASGSESQRQKKLENDSHSRFATKLNSLSENDEMEDEEEEQDEVEEQTEVPQEEESADSEDLNEPESSQEEQKPIEKVEPVGKKSIQIVKPELVEEKNPKKRTSVQEDTVKENKHKQRKVETEDVPKQKVALPKKITHSIVSTKVDTKYTNDKEDFEEVQDFSGSDEEADTNVDIVGDDEIGDVSGLDLHF